MTLLGLERKLACDITREQLVISKQLNPLSPSVKIQNLLTGIHTFSYATNWGNLVNVIAILFDGHVHDSHNLLS